MSKIPVSPAFIFNRAKLVLLNPSSCWSTIAVEATSPKELLISFFLPLSVLGLVCSLIGSFGSPLSYPFSTQVTLCLLALILNAIFLSIFAFLAVKIASFFSGSTTFSKAFSWGVYAWTPSLVAGLFGVFPMLQSLAALPAALYGLYILYKGCGRMTTVPETQHLTFLISLIVAAFVAYLVVGGFAGLLAVPSLVATVPTPS